MSKLPAKSLLIRLSIHPAVPEEREVLEAQVRQELGSKAEWHEWNYLADKHVLIATGTYQFRDPENAIPVVRKLGQLVRKLSDWRPDLYLWTNPAERDERWYVSEGGSRRTYEIISGSQAPTEPEALPVSPDDALRSNRTHPRHRSRLRRTPAQRGSSSNE